MSDEEEEVWRRNDVVASSSRLPIPPSLPPPPPPPDSMGSYGGGNTNNHQQQQRYPQQQQREESNNHNRGGGTAIDYHKRKSNQQPPKQRNNHRKSNGSKHPPLPHQQQQHHQQQNRHRQRHENSITPDRINNDGQYHNKKIDNVRQTVRKYNGGGGHNNNNHHRDDDDRKSDGSWQSGKKRGRGSNDGYDGGGRYHNRDREGDDGEGGEEVGDRWGSGGCHGLDGNGERDHQSNRGESNVREEGNDRRGADRGRGESVNSRGDGYDRRGNDRVSKDRGGERHQYDDRRRSNPHDGGYESNGERGNGEQNGNNNRHRNNNRRNQHRQVHRNQNQNHQNRRNNRSPRSTTDYDRQPPQQQQRQQSSSSPTQRKPRWPSPRSNQPIPPHCHAPVQLGVPQPVPIADTSVPPPPPPPPPPQYPSHVEGLGEGGGVPHRLPLVYERSVEGSAGAVVVGGGDKGNDVMNSSSTIVLTGLPSHVTEDALRGYFINEWQVQVRSVSIIPGPVGDTVGTTVDTIGATATATASVTATTGTNPSVGIEPNEEEVMNLEPPSRGWNEARVELFTRNEAWSIVNYRWKPWDAPILNIESVVIEGTLNDYRRKGPNLLRDGQGGGGGGSTSLDRRPMLRRIKNQLKLQKRRKEELGEELKEERDKKSLLERQEEMLGRQLALHKRMLPLMKDSDKVKKMKEILEIQKKFVGVKREIAEDITPALERLEAEEKALDATIETTTVDVAAAEAAAAEIATAAEALTAATNAAARSASGEGSSSLNPLARSFQLDKRTTVLRVTGIPEDTDLDGVRKEFEVQGAVTDLSFDKTAVEDVSLSAVDSGETIPTLLVRCASRGIAERIRTKCTSYGDVKLTFAWHNEKRPAMKLASDGKCEGGVNTEGVGAVDKDGRDADGVEVTDDKAEVGGNKKGDRSMYWTEDDDLMVDYDDEEDEG